MRIGELSRRSGVSPQLLRTWEQRYGLLEPTRTQGGFRIYSPADERRVAGMKEHLDAGFSASAAARLVLSAEQAPAHPEGALSGLVGSLYDAAREFDEREANAQLDRALDRYTLATVIDEVVMPFLQRLGRGWSDGEITVAQEHFATALLRARLMGLARNWSSGSGRAALLACAPGEHHDLALICFGLALRERGWSITLLGADTPIETLSGAAATLDPDLIVIAAVRSAAFEVAADEIIALGARRTIALAGPGADVEVARRLGALALQETPAAAAERIVHLTHDGDSRAEAG